MRKRQHIWMREKALSLTAIALAAAIAFSLTGCSKGEEENRQESGSSAGEEIPQTPEGYVYVPSFQTLTFPENVKSSDLTVAGDQLYWQAYDSQGENQSGVGTLWHRSLEESGAGEEISLDIETVEGGSVSMDKLNVCPDGSIVCFLRYTDGAGEEICSTLCRYDAGGARLFETDITDVLDGDEENTRIRQAAVGADGMIYACYSSLVRVFSGEDGSLLNTVSLDVGAGAPVEIVTSEGGGSYDRISGLALSREGKVYMTYSDDSSQNGQGTVFQELSPDPGFRPEPKGGLGNINPSTDGVIRPGPEKGVLISTYSGLLGYDPETEACEELFDWTDVNVVAETVRFVQGMEDGRILVYVDDYETDESALVYLTRTEAAQAAQKENVVIGTFFGTSSELQRLVVDFNKTSDKYKVSIRAYVDLSAQWTDTLYSDAVTAMNNDLTGGSGPDLLNLGYVTDLNGYASKGVLEDLSPYLDASSSLKREDFVENVLEGYTVDGKLLCIPKYSQMLTLMGRTSQVGDRTGWTIDDVIALADAYPDAQLIPYSTKDAILSNLVSYGSFTYIDYAAGECHFDSPEFIKLLEFANRFPEDYSYYEDWNLSEEMLAGRILLQDMYISSLRDYQRYSLMFGEPVNLIGYPTPDGSCGSMLRAVSMYGIVSSSKHKEGAWAFLEYMLRYEDPDEVQGYSGFPSRRDMLDDMMEAAMEKEYVRDENGDPVLDEKGEPIEQPRMTFGYGDFQADIYAATQEQVDAVRAAFESAAVILGRDDMIVSIITEEAQAYFAGQKTAQEAASVIQSRVQIYVSENR